MRKRFDVKRHAYEGHIQEFSPDTIPVLEREAEEAASVNGLIDELEYLREVDIFAREGTRIDELVVKGKTTIINLKGTPPDIQDLIVNRICTALFELRKVGRIPPMMLVVEEAQNYCTLCGP